MAENGVSRQSPAETAELGEAIRSAIR